MIKMTTLNKIIVYQICFFAWLAGLLSIVLVIDKLSQYIHLYVMDINLIAVILGSLYGWFGTYFTLKLYSILKKDFEKEENNL